MRVPPSNSRGLSALGISGEDEEKQQHFCHCFSPFYSAACVGALLRTQLAEFLPSLAASLVWSEFWRLLRLHSLIFRTEKFPLSPCFFYYGFANNVKSPFSRKLLLLCLDCLRTKPLPRHNQEQSRPYQRRFFRVSCLS